MMAKIEWYQEVLALEPGSKVFFPYARCLAEDGQRDEALRVLHYGLSLHPEFFEARVFLVALLHEMGDAETCETEVRRIERILTAYPGFWDAWSRLAERDGVTSTALATGLLAASATGGLALDAVLLRGLRGSDEALAEPATLFVPGKAVPAQAMPVQVTPVSTESAQATSVPAAPAQAASGQVGAGEALGSFSIEMPTPVSSSEDESDEALTLRTRSMADVLAEQGDVREAVAIYRELVLGEHSPEERKSLNKRLKQLEKILSQTEPSTPVAAEKAAGDEAVVSTVAEAPSVAEPVARVADEKVAGEGETPVEAGKGEAAQGLRSVLENLAERLEARARS